MCAYERLKAERGIGFEEIVFHIEHGDVLDILEHPNRERDGGQRIFVVARDDYVYLAVSDAHLESSSQVCIRPSARSLNHPSSQPPSGRPTRRTRASLLSYLRLVPSIGATPEAAVSSDIRAPSLMSDVAPGPWKKRNPSRAIQA